MGIVKYSGPVASFHCPNEATIRSLKVHFSPKQLGSGTPSPENVREIVGWDGVEVEHTKNNLAQFEPYGTGGINLKWSVPKSILETDCLIRYSIYIDNSNGNSEACIRAAFFDINGNRLQSRIRSSGVPVGQSKRDYFTIQPFPSGTDYVVFGIKGNNFNIKEPMIDIFQKNAFKETPYEPYKGFTTNYTFGVLGKNKFPASDGTTSDIFLAANTTYTISATSPSAGYFKGWYEDETNTGRIWINAGSDGDRRWKTFTPKKNIVRGVIYVGTGMSECQIELGSTATTYEPYDPNKTVYGGWVDLVSGEVCEEWKSYDLTELSLQQFGIGEKVLTISAFPETIKSRNAMYCNILPPVSNPNISGVEGVDWNNARLNICLSVSRELDTQEKVEQWLNDLKTNNITPIIVANIVNSTIYSLPPYSKELKTFLAQNNIWSNADYVEVEYDLHETQTILARKQFIIANQPHVEKLAAAPLQNFVTDMAAPLKECKVHFGPIQKGSGDPSPDNIRPTSGWNNIITSVNRAPLPEEYQEIEYIQSTSIYSYFITDYYPSDKTDYYIKIHQGNAATDEFYPTAFSAGPQFELYKIGYYVWYNYKGTSYVTPAAYGTNRELLEMFTHDNKWTIIAPNVRTSVYSIPSYDPFISEKPLIILAREVNGEIRDNRINDPYPKLYRLTLYEDNETVRDYVPCYRKSDNEVGLYDLVNKTFLTHSGEGTFTAGPDIVEGDISFTTFPSVINVLNSTTITINKTLSAAGEEISESGMSLTNYIKVNEGDTYKLTFTSKEGARTRRIYSYNANKEPVESLASASWVTVDTVGSIQATIPSGVDYIRVCYKTADENIFLEGPESSVIYGGYIDLNKGELVQEWYIISIDETIPMRAYSPDARNQGTYCEASYWLSTFKAPNAAGYEPYSTDGYCNILPYIENNYSNEARANAANSVSSVCLSGVKTQEEYLAWIAEHGPVIICYRLAAPIHYSLTPTQLKTLRGTNNIWSNSNGDITVQFWRH